MRQKSIRTFFSITSFVLVLTAYVHSQSEPRLDDAANPGSNLNGATITITPSSSYDVYCYLQSIQKDWYKINGGTGTQVSRALAPIRSNVYVNRISESGTATLAFHFQPFQPSDIGEYECRISTASGQPTATLSIYLTTPSPTPTPALTPTPLPPSKVQGVTVTRTSQGSYPSVTVSLRVSWSSVSGSGITYTVCYSTTSGTQSDPPSGANCGASGITGTSTTLGPLSIGTTYYIWVAAVSSGRRGPYSDREQERTYQAVPSLAPEGLSCVETKSNSALLQWSIPLRSGRNGVIFQYIVELYAVTSQDSEFQNVKNFTVALDNSVFDSPSTITYNVTNLSSNAVYRWRVAAVNSAGVGLFTTTAGFTTPEEVSDIHNNGLDAGSNASSDGLSAGLFVAGLFSGIMTVLLVEGIICGVCKISKTPQNKNIEGDYTDPTNIQMTECPAYESIDREGKSAERLYEDIGSRDTKGN